jgi:DUF4097 and DUF4098 domain-containing protein YvlB
VVEPWKDTSVMKTSLWTALLTALCFCATAPAAQAGKVEDSFHQTSPLSSNGIVSLRNINGQVRFSAWEKAEVQVNAVKRGSRQSDLDAVEIEIKAEPGRLRVETKYPKTRWGRSNSTTVDYEIKVPAQTRLNDIVTVNGDIEIGGVHGTVRASTVNGQVVIKGLRANARLESVNGSLEASFEDFNHVESVSLKSVNGKIQVSLPSGANATVDANTLSGSIRTESTLPVKQHLVGSDVRGDLGKGGGRIRAETINGTIRIQREGSPASAAPVTQPKAEND